MGEGVAEFLSLESAIAANVHDGDVVALEGFTHLIPFAAGHEIIRQRRRDLTLVRLTPDLICDQLIGAGCAKKLIFSWGGNPGVGSLHRFRDAVEHDWPHAFDLDEHTHAGLANRFVAGAAGLPFAVLRAYGGTEVSKQSSTVANITCPFTGEVLAAVAALEPDVTVIHAQQADRAGNVRFWGITGVQKESVLAATRAVVTVEEIVDDFDDGRNAVILPSWIVTAIAHVPGGCFPSYASGYSERDNDYYEAWEDVSRDRTTFEEWLDSQVYDRGSV
jgi:glutaconate CoA-transferase subunit A